MLYVTYTLNGLIMIGVPIGLGIYLTSRFKLGWRIWWIGAAAFVLSQVGHIPFNSFLTYLFQQGILPAPPANWRQPFNFVVLGLSAGVWEESFRYIAYRWWVKDARSWRKGLLLGAGHGGIEAILTGALFFYTFAQMIALRGRDLTGLIPDNRIAQATQQITAFWSAAWPMTLLGGLERIFAITTHLALSILVLQVFRRNQIRWLFASITWHALVNIIALAVLSVWGAYATEFSLFIIALLDLLIIFGLRQDEPEADNTDEAGEPVKPLSLSEINPLPDTDESLEQSKYQ